MCDVKGENIEFVLKSIPQCVTVDGSAIVLTDRTTSGVRYTELEDRESAPVDIEKKFICSQKAA